MNKTCAMARVPIAILIAPIAIASSAVASRTSVNLIACSIAVPIRLS